MSPSKNVEAESKTNRPRRRHRLRNTLLIVAGVLVLLVALAPTLLATRPVRGMILSKVNDDLYGRIALDDLSLGWLTGVDVHGLTVFDPQDRQVVRVERVRRGGSLLGLLFNHYGVGQVQVERPEIRLLTDPDGRISLEKAFESRSPSAPKEEATLEKVEDLAIDLQVRQGSIQYVQIDGVERWVRHINLDVSADGLKSLRGELKADVAGGRVTAEYALAGLVEEGRLRLDRATGTASVRAEQPLSVPALAGNDVRAAGSISGNAAIELKEGIRWSARYDASADGLVIGYGESSDLRPVDLSFTGQINQSDSAQMGNLSLIGKAAQGEITRLETSWELDTESLKDASPVSEVLAAMLAGGTVRLPELQAQGKGNFDLVGLSQAVPALLAMRRDLTLQEGRLDFDFQADTRRQPQADATLKLSKIRVRQVDRPVEFEPIDGKLDLTWPQDQSLQGSAELRGDIGTATLASQNGQLKGLLDLDLAPVQHRLAVMTELPHMELAGRLRGQITAEDRRAEGTVPWTTDINGNNIAILAGPVFKQPLQFASLNMKSSGSLAVDQDGKLTAVDVAELNLSIDSARLTGRGRYNLATNSPEDFRLTADAGDLRHVQGWLAAVGYFPAETTVTGSANISATGQYTSDGELSISANGQARGLEVVHPRLRPVRWETAGLDAALNYNTRSREIALADGRQIQVSAPAGQIKVMQLSGALEPLRLEMQAQVQDVDISQIALFGLVPEDTELLGMVSGPLSGRFENGVLRLTRNEMAIRQFVFARADIGRIDWPQATLNAPLEYDTNTSRFKAGGSAAVATTPWGQLEADLDGTVKPLTISGRARLQALDVASITQALRPMLGLGNRYFTGTASLSTDLRQPSGQPLVCDGELRVEKLGTDRQLLSAEPMVLRWEGTRVDLQGSTAGKIVRADKVNLSSDIARADASNVLLDLTGPQPMLSATVEAGADLKTLREAVLPLLADPASLPPLAGQFTYRGQGRTENQTIAITGSGQVSQLVVGEGERAFRQDKIDLAQEITVDTAQAVIHVNRFALASPLFQTELSGKVNDYQGQKLLDLSGRYRGDLEQATSLLHQLRPELAQDIKSIRGALDWPLAVNGSLANPKITPGYRQLDATAGINWEGIEAYGLTIGPGRIPLELADGRIDIPATPIEANNGQLLMTGVLSLFTQAEPAEPANAWRPRYSLAGTHQVLRDITITREFSSKQLQRLNPVLFFQPKSISGAVSLTLTDVDLPLGEEIKTAGRIRAGRLDVRDLRIEPNSTFAEVLDKMGQFTGQTGSVQTEGLDFYMANGRIHYDRFDIIYNNIYRLRFSGSVGLDETVELTLNLPITPELLRKLGVSVAEVPGLNLMQLLSDVYLPIPITGNPANMKPDFSGSAKLMQTIVEKAIENFLKGGRGVGELLKDIVPGVQIPQMPRLPELPRR